MKPKKILLFFSVFFAIVSVDVKAELVDVSADTLEKWITIGTVFDFILIDIRDTSELTSVIATDACRPYHLSLREGAFVATMNKLPKGAHIFLYCRTGSRTRTAGQLLVDSGYVSVYHLVGGITGWTGPTKPGSAVKPASELPAPSMLKIATRTVERPDQTMRGVVIQARSGVVSVSAPLNQDHWLGLYTMQGRCVARVKDPFKFSSRFALPGKLSRCAYVARLSVLGSRESGVVFTGK